MSPPETTPTSPNGSRGGSAGASVPSTQQTEPSSGQKRKRPEDGGDDYHQYGRAACRLVGPLFIANYSIQSIVETGLEQEARDDDDSDLDLEPDSEQDIIRKRLLRSWQLLCAIIPDCKEAMVEALQKKRLRQGPITAIKAGSNSARQDDTALLKERALDYINVDASVPISPPLPLNANSLKSIRGWNHPATARLLTPMEYEANEQTFLDIKTGKLRATADQWPRFLYPDNHVYNPIKEIEGLFMGHYVLRVIKHIYMSRSSALQGPGFHKGKAPVAVRIGMTTCTARAIAYACVQGRVAISDIPEWNNVDRHFNLVEFYWNIVEVLEMDSNAHILKFFDEQLFGTRIHQNDTRSSASSSNNRISAAQRMARQMAAERTGANPPPASSLPALPSLAQPTTSNVLLNGDGTAPN